MTDKQCKACRWCRRDWFLAIISFGNVSPLEFSKCGNPKAYGNSKIRSEFVDAERVGYAPKIKPATFCSTERMDYETLGTCGPEAKLWEPQR